ncbi:MAG: hypothetical protein Q9M18_01015 [Mariprofundaceae bacterium]|nr:hypothetical protein [Mariprofundaceae bacterium]
MSQQLELFAIPGQDDRKVALGNNLFVLKNDDEKTAIFFKRQAQIRVINLKDKLELKLALTEISEMGATKAWLCEAFGISRQTLHNYEKTKLAFGLEGLANSYKGKGGIKKFTAQRSANREALPKGNTNVKLREIRKARKEKEQAKIIPIDQFFEDNYSDEIETDNQIFSETHDWKATRYAGVFIYLIALFSQWNWLKLIQSAYGKYFAIFPIFLLMVAKNVRSIEALKNIRLGEAGLILGIRKIPGKAKVWEMFYLAAEMKKSSVMIKAYFLYQIKSGLVSFWIWATDGHLLPYSGNKKVHYSYSTQRRMPMPGQTNAVTCDNEGRIVDFEIEEGKGDLRSRIIELKKKWGKELPSLPMMIFDREGSGAKFFHQLISENIPFCTWKKNVDAKELNTLDDNLYTHKFEFNGKKYQVFERKKGLSFEDDNKEKITFDVREIVVWNVTSKRKTCALAWTGDRDIDCTECAKGILSRWGASENTFKHIKGPHPFHYHPGFSASDSTKQDVANPVLKEVKEKVAKKKNELAKLYKTLSKIPETLNSNGTLRQNSHRDKCKASIVKNEAELKTLQDGQKGLPERVDFSELENYRSFQKIDNEGKNMFDFVTTSVWNVRKMMVAWLKEAYKHDNEVVDLFYAITNCHGWIKVTSDQVVVRLEPLQQPSRRAAQEYLCRKLNSTNTMIPGGRYLSVEVGAPQ